MSSVEEVIGAIQELVEDEDTPKNIATKLKGLCADIGSDQEISLTVNKAMSELEDMSSDVNIPAFVKTQIWSIISLLGALESEIIEA